VPVDAGPTTAPKTGELLDYARKFLGRPYVYGAAGPDEFDCSGLVTFVFKHFGISLPHHSQDQARHGTPVPPDQITAGDLVFSDWGDGPNSHVGIATSGDQIIVAPHTGALVQLQSLSPTYRSHITAVRRITGLTGGGGPTTVPTRGGGLGEGLDPLGIAAPFRELADVFRGIQHDLDTAMLLFTPTGMVRLFAGGAGIIFIAVGIYFLAREVR
jgi:hypothetical protein